ncbi:ubiquinone anaerobic biosynthesis accessory factor UbiT [Janthinobacterium fluminis]|uniref:Ubiquinone biosynthesis accessory factor UbiT n=1 Tax=Janthinobacterium fluminis TaxID=2987524 RepID=A0ABT5JWC4_9BURK|nr:SCP2 sterol-binding domain-containing protein [Janthinobacterium fluminis]MDC8757040.1 SCP2 sterol-binding domain-containing protein [Janthinobacterium fluminis]
MQDKRYTLPEPAAKMLALLPAYPGSWLFVQALNLALAQQLPQDVRARLEGKKLRLRVDDARVAFDFEWRNGAFAACRPQAESDLTIGAAAHDFVLLARRQEDPDTLFFSRRLALEGDTELGLLFKNTLDALDVPAFDLAALAPGRVLAHLRRGRASR